MGKLLGWSLAALLAVSLQAGCQGMPQRPVADPAWIDEWTMFDNKVNNQGSQFDTWMDTPGMAYDNQQDDASIEDWVTQYGHVAQDPEYEPLTSHFSWDDYYKSYYQDFYANEDQYGANNYEYPAADGAEIEPAEQVYPEAQLPLGFGQEQEGMFDMFDSSYHPALDTFDDTADTLSDAFFEDPDMWNAQAFSGGQDEEKARELAKQQAKLEKEQQEQRQQQQQIVPQQELQQPPQLSLDQPPQQQPKQEQTPQWGMQYTQQNMYSSMQQAYEALLQYYNSRLKAAGITEYQTELPDFLANQLSEYYYNAWQAQTVGQSSYQDALSHFYPSNATLVDGQSLVPNRPLHPGVPNKTPEQTLDLDALGFHLGESPIYLEKEECITDEDEDIGQCMSPKECGYQHGQPNGLCHQGHDASAHLRVCCTFPTTCGYETNKEFVYFKNPEYPQISNSSPECHFRVRLLPDVCQIRVDFLEFETKNKTDGICDENNQLEISSPFARAYIPVQKFCGSIKKEEKPARTDLNHIYINFDDIPMDSLYKEAVHHKDPYIDFKMISLNHTTKWNIRIIQVACDGAPLHSPAGCGQYFNSANGTISSLNIGELDENVKLTSCLRTDTTACAVRFKIKQMQVGNKKKLGYGLTCQNFMSINGMKSGICGFAEEKEIILPIDGPQAINYVHEELSTFPETYEITYDYLHNCEGVEFFKYPSAK